jgi:predicted alpha/beta superfamily hydrolase
MQTTQRTVYYISGFQAPQIQWRTNHGEAFVAQPMVRGEAGRNPGEYVWSASFLTASAANVQFAIECEGKRDPQKRYYEFNTTIIFVQDGQLFSYRPAAQVDAPQRAYSQKQVPQIFSKILNEYRGVRVYLPRGYRQHNARRYAVVYFQDGQNVFENGPFGSWSATATLDRLTARGQMEEVIAVAVDHGSNRYNDFVPPQDGGRADQYARFLAEELKPWIDANYRTSTQSSQQALIGSSLGAVAATYVGWEKFHVFGKVAALSGSWWLKKFQAKLVADIARPLKFYLDCGDSGPYRDGIHHCKDLVQQLESRLSWSNGQEFLFQIGEGQSHTESAWAFRLKFALSWLFPLNQSSDEKLNLPLSLRVGSHSQNSFSWPKAA